MPLRRLRASSTSSAPRPASRPTPTRATPPPARSASSTRSSPPRARCRSGATRSARSRGSSSTTHSEALEWLREHGFRVNRDVEVPRRRRRRWSRPASAWEERRDAARLRDRRRRRQGRRPRRCSARLGVVGREPRGAIAWKFPPMTATTTLRAIQWNVGRTGHMVPFAELEPVQVTGVTVKLATLHNEEDMLRKDVREGDEVIVTRAGDVIPQVVVARRRRRRSARAAPRRPEPPAKCPACGTPTVKPEGGVWTICPNRAGCPGQLLPDWSSIRQPRRDGHRGLGEERVLQFLQRGRDRRLAGHLRPDRRSSCSSSRASARCRRAT